MGKIGLIQQGTEIQYPVTVGEAVVVNGSTLAKILPEKAEASEATYCVDEADVLAPDYKDLLTIAISKKADKDDTYTKAEVKELLESNSGIKSIDQSVSPDDENANIVTITLSNNEQHHFTIRNGSSYILTDDDKDDIAKRTLLVVGSQFATKQDIATVRIADAKPAVNGEGGVDGYAKALDTQTYIEDNLNRVLHFEDYVPEPIIITI